MTDRRALFRADASVEIGIGHVMRCRTLAQVLVERGWSVTLASRDLPAAMVGSMTSAGIGVLEIPLDLTIPEEPRWLQLRAGAPIPLLVVDHYKVDASWLEQARRWVSSIVAIDDLADRALPVDVVVNQNLGAATRRYESLTPPAARLLIGPMFALLRHEFGVAHERRRPRFGGIDRILVFVSGADRPDVTRRGAEAAAAAGVNVDVVVGAAYPHLASLRRWAADHPRVGLHVNTTAMVHLMERADLSIGAPSSASWERCAVGLPSILIVMADNQREPGRLLAESGAALTLGWHEAIGVQQITRAIDSLRADPALVASMSDTAAAITDGRGTSRVVLEIEGLMNPPARPAAVEEIGTVEIDGGTNER